MDHISDPSWNLHEPGGSFNSTGLDVWQNGSGGPEYHSTPYRVVGTILTVLIFAVGSVGNVMVVLVVLRSKSMRSSTNCYLVSLAFADLLLLLSATLPTIAEYYLIVDQFVFGALACSIMVFLQYLGFNLSSLSITALTAERYVAICRPMKAQSLCTVGRAKRILAVLWIFGFCYSAPWLGLATTRVKPGMTDVEHCTFTLDRHQYLAYYMADLLVMYLIPVVISAVLYALIATTLYKSHPVSACFGNGTADLQATSNSCRSTSSKVSYRSSCKSNVLMKGLADCNHFEKKGNLPEVRSKGILLVKDRRKLKFNLINFGQTIFQSKKNARTIDLSIDELDFLEINETDDIPEKNSKQKTHSDEKLLKNDFKEQHDDSKDVDRPPEEGKIKKKIPISPPTGRPRTSKSLEHLEMFTYPAGVGAGHSASDENIKGTSRNRISLKLKGDDKISSDPQRRTSVELCSKASENASRCCFSNDNLNNPPETVSRQKIFNDGSRDKSLSSEPLDGLAPTASGGNAPSAASTILLRTLPILTTPISKEANCHLAMKGKRLSTSVPSIGSVVERNQYSSIKERSIPRMNSDFSTLGSRMNMAASSILIKNKEGAIFSLSSASASSTQNLNSRLQIIKMLVVVVGLFTILWLPYRLYMVYNSFIEKRFEDIWLMLMCRIMIYTNSAINPILYNAMSVKFKKAFKRLWSCDSKDRKWHVTSKNRSQATLRPNAGMYRRREERAADQRQGFLRSRVAGGLNSKK